jgi:malonyl-CoA/methylmalonyl-CoA synthetase
MGNHMFDAIRAAEKHRDAPFIVTEAGRTWTYGDLLDFSGRLAHRLIDLGVTPGDRVAVQVEKSPEALMLYVACLRAGAVYLPLNTGYTLNELAYFVGDAEPRLVIVAPKAEAAITPLAEEHGGRVATLDEEGSGSLLSGLDAEVAFTDVERGPHDLAAILYTSGTTGRSKGAMLSHDNLLSNARTLIDHWQFSASDRLIHALPIFHTHGLFVATNVTMLSGASMDFLPKFDPVRIMSLMDSATCLMGVPTFYTRLLQEDGLTREKTANIRLFISGSAPLLADTHREFVQRTGKAILERYGMTETNMNTSNPYDGERIAGTVGHPLPGVSVRICDPETGTELANDEIGMIEVKGPNVFKGYWRMPEKTEAEFRADGYFITGDLGKIDPRGYVHIVGRGKDLVISGGYNVYPKEIETEIDQIAGVVESAVIGVPHPDFGEGVTAIVVRSGDNSVSEGDIMTALNEKLARYKQPKSVHFVADLPRNTMGKVQKNVLRQTYNTIYQNKA